MRGDFENAPDRARPRRFNSEARARGPADGTALSTRTNTAGSPRTKRIDRGMGNYLESAPEATCQSRNPEAVAGAVAWAHHTRRCVFPDPATRTARRTAGIRLHRPPSKAGQQSISLQAALHGANRLRGPRAEEAGAHNARLSASSNPAGACHSVRRRETPRSRCRSVQRCHRAGDKRRPVTGCLVETEFRSAAEGGSPEMTPTPRRTGCSEANHSRSADSEPRQSCRRPCWICRRRQSGSMRSLIVPLIGIFIVSMTSQ
jgi:hypothetical protein